LSGVIADDATPRRAVVRREAHPAEAWLQAAVAGLPIVAALQRHAWQDQQSSFPAFVLVHWMAQFEGTTAPASLRCFGKRDHPDPWASSTPSRRQPTPFDVPSAGMTA
jgi:hypothetical protein